MGREHVHVVGAGLAGLAAALDLSEGGARAVTVWEASGHAGGRCWSFADRRLGRVIDNGNHLILSGNRAVLDHAARLGVSDRLAVSARAAFPFVDLETGEGWEVTVPPSPLGGWRRGARPAGTGLRDLGDVARLLMAGADATVAEAIPGRGAMWRRFWEPMTLAVLNAAPGDASAALLRAGLRRSFLRGAAQCRPVFAPEGLGAALVDPAVARLAEQGVRMRYRAAVAGLEAAGGRVCALTFADGSKVEMGPDDAVVVAVPPAAASALVPGWNPALVPGAAIVNAHFRVAPGAATGLPPILGVIGGAVQWIFVRGDVVSTTVSGVVEAGGDRAGVLPRHWADVARATGLAAPLASRLLVERRATFAQTPAGHAARHPLRTALSNLVLAGDHIATGLPATLEGAILSGRRAASALMTG